MLYIDRDFTQEADYIAEARRKAIEKLGDKWILHPSNHVQKKKATKKRK